MKQLLWLLLFVVPFCTKAQNLSPNASINWANELTWQQIKKKAHNENKFIFVDAFATWCLPCKQMETEVYTDSLVTSLINQNFIALKLQVDTSAIDNNNTKSWYADASYFQKEYKVQGVPTFLFFDSNGQLVHKDVGARTCSEFVSLLKSSLDTSQQIFTQCRKFQNGQIDQGEMSAVANQLRSLGERELAYTLANCLIENSLLRLPVKQLTQGQFFFIASFISGINTAAFRFIYSNRPTVDSIVQEKDYAEKVVAYYIAKECVKPYLQSCTTEHTSPNWNRIFRNLKSRFDLRSVNRVLLNSKLEFYQAKSDWKALVKYNTIKIQKYGLDTLGVQKVFVNNMLWEVFLLHSEDPIALRNAVKWMKILVDSEPNSAEMVDTYANLLYKAGKTSEAIVCIEKLLKADEEKIAKGEHVNDYVYHQETLRKMQNKIPTWIKD